MQIPTLVLIIGLEAALALIILCVLLALYARKVKKLLARQQEQLRQAMQRPVAASPPVAPPTPAETSVSPQAYLQEQLEATSQVFAAEAPDTDIANAQPSELSSIARIAAIRHAILSAETNGDDAPGLTNEQWQALGQKLQALFSAEEGRSDDAQALENAQKRIQNLEKFKKLFFEMEDKWNAARSDAQNYHDQLAGMTEGVEDQEQFEAVLAKYHAVYDGISDSIEEAADSGSDAAKQETGETKTVTVTKPDPRTTDQLHALRNVAADQHRLINKLQKQLQDAQTAEQKEVVIQDLQGQLAQQERYVKESETCVKLLESELDTAIKKLNEYEVAAEASAGDEEEIKEMRATLHQFTLETKELLKRLEALETENQSLKSGDGAVQTKPGAGADTTNAEADAQLTSLKEKYSSLETQYAELEEKYLDLRAQ
ncbi:hypothetical protein QWI17_00655 [Gilvimarinus sp. SDUM040013]|uniref:Chromosome partition protein Smc n=1 Tax=Gilvimarinus gilvus TaxID=3058038 RepID=A0ABU4S6I2_9GAMM|nr:hypothetical protein [Gilvimarinus sp. SDUM040013]MDO3384340.1 hypothetical protein [Gilvimarinus sp. SDUM040013]MDX6851508.1 hypothetical protein [Gilvimarinus sp. SDUM040013]